MKEYILYRFHLDGTLIHSVRMDVEKVPVPDSKREQWTKEHYGGDPTGDIVILEKIKYDCIRRL